MSSAMMNVVSSSRRRVTPYEAPNAGDIRWWWDASQTVGHANLDFIDPIPDLIGSNHCTNPIGTDTYRMQYLAGYKNGKGIYDSHANASFGYGTVDLGLTQPFTLFLVARLKSGSTAGAFIDTWSGGRSLIAPNSTDAYQLYAGGFDPTVAVGASNAWVGIVGIFNGSSSKMYLNSLTPVTGNPGTNGFGVPMIGFWSGAWGGWAAQYAEGGAFAGNIGSTNAVALESHLLSKWGI